VALVSDAQLHEVLRAQNPWWVSGALPQRARHTPARRPDDVLRGSDRPALLCGPRRSGKTATLMRLVDAHLRAARAPKGVAYLPLDHPLLRLVPLGPLVDATLALMDQPERPLVLLDSLQGVPQWPERFLEVVSTRPQPRFVAATSVAAGLTDPAFDTVHLGPLSFREFCDLRGLPDLGAPDLDPFDPRLPEESRADDRLYSRVLDPILADYLVRGGFPTALFTHDLSVAHQAVREGVVARAIYEDLPAVVGVQTLADLERVLLGVLLQGGAPLQMEAFSDSVGLDSATVGRYLGHLQRAFLLSSLKNFAASTDRSRARLFPTDPGLPNALFERGVSVLAQPDERRALLAGAVVSHVEAAARERGFDVAYFREGDLQADVVLVSPEGAVPIVLVDREDVGEEDVALVERLMKRIPSRSAILLSRAGPRRKESVTFFETIWHLPAAYFLYALHA
jgi:predicted AAA+ superfamily ATPase